MMGEGAEGRGRWRRRCDPGGGRAAGRVNVHVRLDRLGRRREATAVRRLLLEPRCFAG